MRGCTRQAKALTWFMLAAVLAGCGYSGCTTAGCVSGVTVALTGVRAVQGPVRVRHCVDDKCQTSVDKHWHALVSNEDADLEVGRPVGVSLTVAAHGRTVVDAATTVDPKQTAPNGERCGPVCTVAFLHLVDGGLVSAG